VDTLHGESATTIRHTFHEISRCRASLFGTGACHRSTIHIVPTTKSVLFFARYADEVYAVADAAWSASKLAKKKTLTLAAGITRQHPTI
jgi:hypothetical protein